MTLHTPLLISPGSGDPTIYTTQSEFRNFLGSLTQGDFNVRNLEGVFGTTFAVQQRGAGANFSIDVLSGRAFVVDDDVTNGGVYWVWNDATYNLATPGAPASGTRHHRVVLQMRNKGENGAYTTYDFVPTVVQDTGGGMPAEPASSLTLAQVNIASTDTSVTNSSIVDYRARVGLVQANKAATTARTATSMTVDPDLQLNNLQPNAVYKITGIFIWDADASAGIQWTWLVGASSIYRYTVMGVPVQGNSGTGTGSWLLDGSATFAEVGTGTGIRMGAQVNGILYTAAAPCWLQLSWSRTTSSSNPTNLQQYSYLCAEQIG